jgi:hypothetical protein
MMAVSAGAADAPFRLVCSSAMPLVTLSSRLPLLPLWGATHLFGPGKRSKLLGKLLKFFHFSVKAQCQRGCHQRQWNTKTPFVTRVSLQAQIATNP